MLSWKSFSEQADRPGQPYPAEVSSVWIFQGTLQARYGANHTGYRQTVGSVMPAKSLGLRHTIRLIRELDAEIADIEASVQSIMEELPPLPPFPVLE